MIRHVRPVPAAALALSAALALALAACGSSDEPSTTAAGTTTTTVTQATPSTKSKGRFTINQIEDLVGLKPIEGGKAWTSITGCRVTVIMTTHAEVLTYRTTQDEPVVTNPADDVGVKFDPVPGCRDALTANLTKVK